MSFALFPMILASMATFVAKLPEGAVDQVVEVVKDAVELPGMTGAERKAWALDVLITGAELHDNPLLPNAIEDDVERWLLSALVELVYGFTQGKAKGAPLNPNVFIEHGGLVPPGLTLVRYTKVERPTGLAPSPSSD